eukprot:XP_001694956.1 predicted protein [Chlamydomonas reinhardtii]
MQRLEPINSLIPTSTGFQHGVAKDKATKAAISAALKGKTKTKAHKDAISAAMKGKGKGKPKDKAHKDAISAAMITCICSVCKTCKGRARVQKFQAKKA